MNTPKRGEKEALQAARYFGAEYQANLPHGDSRFDYYENIAWYYGEGKKWADLPPDFKAAAVTLFNEGVQAEKKHQ